MKCSSDSGRKEYRMIALESFLDKAKQPIAFLNEDVVLSESWIKQRETANAKYIYQFDTFCNNN